MFLYSFYYKPPIPFIKLKPPIPDIQLKPTIPNIQLKPPIPDIFTLSILSYSIYLFRKMEELISLILYILGEGMTKIINY